MTSAQQPDSPRSSPLGDFVRGKSDSTSGRKIVENRRGFFAKSSIAIAGGAVLATEQAVAMVPHVGGSDCLRVGVIGCGNRGKSAVAELLQTQSTGPAKNIKLVAMADAFGSQLQAAYRSINSRFANQIDVSDRRFAGMDGWRRLLACELDLVILATPPVFRPMQLEGSIAAGKHVMMESPVAIDDMGLNRVREAGLLAETTGFNVAAGLHRRHDVLTRETIDELHRGRIGELLCANVSVPTKPKPLSKPASKMSNHDYQLRNWSHFNWTGGGRFDARLLHAVDVMNWAMRSNPVEAREMRSGAIAYRLPDERMTVVSMNESQSQQSSQETIVGLDGHCDIRKGVIRDRSANVIWRSRAKPSVGDAWQSQANRLVHAILNGQNFNDTELAIASTSAWLMGRAVAQLEFTL